VLIKREDDGANNAPERSKVRREDSDACGPRQELRTECPFEWRDEQRAARSDAATEDQRLGVEEVHDAGQSAPQRRGALGQYRPSDGIGASRRAHNRAKVRCGRSPRQLRVPSRHCGARCICLEMAEPSATAARPVAGANWEVADLSRGACRTALDDAVVHERTADSGTYRRNNQSRIGTSGPQPGLSERQRIHVVVDDDVQAERFLQSASNGCPSPTDESVARRDDDPAPGVDHARRPDTDPDNMATRAGASIKGATDQGRDRLEHPLAIRGNWRRDDSPGNQRSATRPHADRQFGPTNVNADGVRRIRRDGCGSPFLRWQTILLPRTDLTPSVWLDLVRLSADDPSGRVASAFEEVYTEVDLC
jgi:hypothetical protein